MICRQVSNTYERENGALLADDYSVVHLQHLPHLILSQPDNGCTIFFEGNKSSGVPLGLVPLCPTTTSFMVNSGSISEFGVQRRRFSLAGDSSVCIYE